VSASPSPHQEAPPAAPLLEPLYRPVFISVITRFLQRQGTKKATRLLQRLSGREKRHMGAINHMISKQIVETAQTTQRQIALEKLTGIRRRTKVWNAAMNIAAAGVSITGLAGTSPESVKAAGL
jgi:pyruvate dehydrogenase complex dehydrogenase (E1) component